MDKHNPQRPMTLKVCTKCWEAKSLENFAKGKNGLFGLRTKCKDCVKEYNAEYRNSANGRFRMAKGVKAYGLRLRNRIFDKLGHRCVRCGFDDKRALQIDHVLGGGKQELRSLSRHSYMVKVLEDTDNRYQILCANCNWIKRHENQETKPSVLAGLQEENVNAV